MKSTAGKNLHGLFPVRIRTRFVVWLTTTLFLVTCIVGVVCAEPTHQQPPEWQTVQMRVTAYCPCEQCCGEYSDGQTASGHNIQPGDAFVAADTQYPFGTEMVIEGYDNDQPVKVLDRGGAIKGNRLDVFFHTHQEALNWGVKYIDVKVQLAS
ncbi:MAG: 3D domain-containing protein [Planctomycetota bacterium]|nr:MAG: 3D domain-containing protein [Planctomycetota bacterium]